MAKKYKGIAPYLAATTTSRNGNSLTLENLNKIMETSYGAKFQTQWGKAVLEMEQEKQMKQLERFLKHWKL